MLAVQRRLPVAEALARLGVRADRPTDRPISEAATGVVTWGRPAVTGPRGVSRCNRMPGVESRSIAGDSQDVRTSMRGSVGRTPRVEVTPFAAGAGNRHLGAEASGSVASDPAIARTTLPTTVPALAVSRPQRGSWPRSTTQNRLPSGSASTTKSGSSGSCPRSTRSAPSDASRATSAACCARRRHGDRDEAVDGPAEAFRCARARSSSPEPSGGTSTMDHPPNPSSRVS